MTSSSKSHISDDVRAELKKQILEIRKGVLAVADADVKGKPSPNADERK